MALKGAGQTGGGMNAELMVVHGLSPCPSLSLSHPIATAAAAGLG